MSITIVKDITLKSLSEKADGLAVSIFFPLELRAQNPEANRIRLKNSLADAKAILYERLDKTYDAHEFLTAAAELEHHDIFRNARYPGLAVLGTLDRPKELKVVPLKFQPEPLVRVGESHYLIPFIRNTCERSALLLNLSDNEVELFRREGGSWEVLELPEGCPKNLEEVTRYERSAGLDGNELYRTKTAATRYTTTHGDGPTTPVEEEFERRYLRQIGESLKDDLVEGEKILLGCVHEKAVLFRDVNSELPIFDVEMLGNHEHDDKNEMLKKATSILLEIEAEELSQELQEVDETVPERRLIDMDALAEASKLGRIETLYIASGTENDEAIEPLLGSVVETGGSVKFFNGEDREEKALGVTRW